jgi:iron-sulfur cluster assembly protein
MADVATINTMATDAKTIDTGISGTDAEDTIVITSKALKEVKKIKGQNNIPEHFGLRVGVKGGGCSGFTYTLGFDAEPNENDYTYDMEGVTVFVDPKSLFYLMGVELDFSDGLNGRGFTFNNPNATKTCGCGSSFGV